MLRGLIAELAPAESSEITDASVLVDDLEYHSLALMELAFTIEDEFDLEPIDEETAQAIRTVKDVQDLVIRALSERAPLVPSQSD